MNDLENATHRLLKTEAELAYNLHVFGDELAKRNGYKAHKDINAVHYYLILKHHWTPEQVRSMRAEDLRFCLEEEMHGWTLPPESRP